ncbi:MAG: hypothetical protein U0791_24370 [Gemmataceae bacterium]
MIFVTGLKPVTPVAPPTRYFLASLNTASTSGRSFSAYTAYPASLRWTLSFVYRSALTVPSLFSVSAVSSRSFACTLHYAVTITDDDPDSGYTDPDDGDRRFVFRRSGTVEGDDEAEVTLTLQYDQAHPDQITFGTVAFAQKEIHVSFEDGDLSRDDDGDYDDYGFSDDEPPEQEPSEEELSEEEP